jgi:hypothetical protein
MATTQEIFGLFVFKISPQLEASNFKVTKQFAYPISWFNQNRIADLSDSHQKLLSDFGCPMNRKLKDEKF